MHSLQSLAHMHSLQSLALTCMQVQEETLQQAELAASHASRMDAINTDLQDTQKLLAALQSEWSLVAFHMVNRRDQSAVPHQNVLQPACMYSSGRF